MRCQSRHFLTRALFATTTLVATLASSPAMSQISTTGETAVSAWFQFLTQVNRYSPLEGAYSHGSTGLTIGAGGSRHELANQTEIAQQELGVNPEEQEIASIDIPRIWVTKGTPWPVDFGLSAAKVPGHDLSLLAGHMQWTFFEALAMPAFALRASYSQVMGLKNTKFTSKGADLVASYGFLRYFTVYGAFGMIQNASSMTIDHESEYSFMLTGPSDEAASIARSERDNSYLYGLRIAILPPFVALTAESQSSTDGSKHYAAKLSVWL